MLQGSMMTVGVVVRMRKEVGENGCSNIEEGTKNGKTYDVLVRSMQSKSSAR